MNFDPGLEQLRGDQATFESAQELSHIFSYNLRPKKLFLVWVDFPALCLKVAKCDWTNTGAKQGFSHHIAEESAQATDMSCSDMSVASVLTSAVC